MPSYESGVVDFTTIFCAVLGVAADDDHVLEVGEFVFDAVDFVF